ncbi:MAG TPA: phytanoyl-CoA dioxygenase family protein [Iamia sp.]
MPVIDTLEAVASAELHPWNDAFVPRDRVVVPRRLSSAQVDAYHGDGFLLVEDVFDPDRLAAVAAEIDPHERRMNDLLQQLGGRVEVAAADALTVTLHLSTFAPACRALAYEEAVADLAHDLVGPDVRLYWDQAVYKLPRNPDVVPWHQDNGYAYVEPQDYLTLWVPLVDATLANGTVWVVPGGHRRGTLVHQKVECGQACLPESTEGAVPVEAPAGSVIAFSSLTPHRTGPNDTDAVRSAYILQYAPDGAEVLEGDPAAGDPVRRFPCADPGRQHPILVGGRWSPPAPL